MEVRSDQIDTITMYDMPLEKALDTVATLKHVTRFERNNLTVYAGLHPALGSIYVVLPPMGNPVVLPLFAAPPDESLDERSLSALDMMQKNPIPSRDELH